MNGWFAVKRGITKHPIFEGHPERLAIWIWLLDNAAWKDTPHDINGKTVMVPRGSVSASERRIAKEVGVGRQVVRTFLDRLQSEHMINPDLTHGRRIIHLCNYEKYQNAPDGDNPPLNPRLTHDQPTKEQENNSSDTYVSGADAPDPVKVMFDSGISLMAKAGVSERHARSLLGRWKAKHGTEAVISVLGRAQREGAIDPVAFCEGCFRQKARGGYRQNGDRLEYDDAFGGGPLVR